MSLPVFFRLFAHGMLAILVASIIGSTTSVTIAADKPNVLFIAVDDLRTELGCYQAAVIKSPNIDRLAKSGMLFERAYCQVAVCNPSRVSVLTGLRPDTTRVWDLVTRFRNTIPDAVTLPAHFVNNGYHAVSFGKIFHNPWPDNQSWSEPHSWPSGTSIWSPQAKQRLAKFRKTMEAEGRPQKKTDRMRAQATEALDIPDAQHIDGGIAEQAITSMRELAEKDQPFFLAAGFVRPHLPFVVPRKYWELYSRETIPLAENPFLPKQSPSMATNTMYELRDYLDFDGTPSPDLGSLTVAQQQELKHGYFASVSFIDTLIGTLLDELDRLQLADNTIVVLWSDHGWKLGEHNSWCKQTNYEIDTRVPLIIRAPSTAAKGKSTKALVELIDLFPTLCELAGLPILPELEGRSMVPLLEEGNVPWKDAAFSQFKRKHGGVEYMGYAMRTDRYRYIEWQRRDSREVVATELYDHTDDPREDINVASDANYQSIVESLREKMWRTLPAPPVTASGIATSATPPRPQHAPQGGNISNSTHHLNSTNKSASADAALAENMPQDQPTEQSNSDDSQEVVAGYRNQTIKGWPVRVSEKLLDENPAKTERALALLTTQLQSILDVVPKDKLALIRNVPIWISPPYPGFTPTAEYHPSAGWLQSVGRPVELAKCVELTNVDIFETECKRMPMMLLHEMAHAYHHQVLGFDNARIQAAYARAKASGSYDAVKRNNGRTETAYGMNNAKEYFAESSEAYFGTNDFFPFNRQQLQAHDPNMVKLLEQLW